MAFMVTAVIVFAVAMAVRAEYKQWQWRKQNPAEAGRKEAREAAGYER